MKHVEVIAKNPINKNLMESTLEAVSKIKFKAFELDFFRLDRVVYLEDFEDALEYDKTYGTETANEDSFKTANACYEPKDRAIYLYGTGDLKYSGPTMKIMVLLHELSHYIMDYHDIFSRYRYATDPIYRLLEEVRVNNMSYYIAKHFLTDYRLDIAKNYVRGYREMMHWQITAAQTFTKAGELYLQNGRGICSLMDLADELDG